MKPPRPKPAVESLMFHQNFEGLRMGAYLFLILSRFFMVCERQREGKILRLQKPFTSLYILSQVFEKQLIRKKSQVYILKIMPDWHFPFS